ncbi:MAG: nitroreductase family protein [Desulfobacterales bacterium]|nr:nitroreductase family protein [Desulfobacterales bacterium]
MMIADLIIKNRSCRRFYQNHKVNTDTLESLVNLARLSASAANMQPLKYILTCDPEKNDMIFPCLAWAAYLKDWSGPDVGERPSAYIIMLGDTSISTNFWCDHGIAAQSILLGAGEISLAGCIIASINKKMLRSVLKISDQYEILLVIAVGKPKEEAIIEPMGEDGNIRYWRDINGIHHVPKRSLDDIIINSFPDSL